MISDTETKEDRSCNIDFVDNFGSRREDEFIENNIRFRIISSKMLERYKNTQSFVLTEMLHGQYKFSRTSREIMLFSMDKWFNWLTHLERDLIRESSNIFTNDVMEATIKNVVRTDSLILGTIMSRHDVFDCAEAHLWMESRKETILGWQVVLKTYEGREITEAFSSISSFLVEAIESMKFSLYETDYLVNNGKRPFICITNTCLRAKEDHNINILENKLKVFRRYNKDMKEIVVKNYSDARNIDACISGLNSLDGIKLITEEIGGIS